MKPDDLRNIYATPVRPDQDKEAPIDLPLTKAHRVTRNNSLTAMLLVIGVLVVAVYAVVLQDRQARLERALNAAAPVDSGAGDGLQALSLRINEPRLNIDPGVGEAIGLSVHGLNVDYFFSPASAQDGLNRERGQQESLDQLILTLARRMIDEGAYDEAEQNLERITGTDAAADEVLELRALIHVNREQPGEAVTLYEQLVEKNPYQEAYLNNLAVSLFRKGEPGQAEQALLRALRINPDYHEARINLVLYLLSERRYEEAASRIRPVVEQQPRNAVARHCLAVALLQRNALSEARRHFEELTLMAPDDVAHFFNVARTFSLDNNVSQSIAWLKLAEERCDEATFQQTIQEPEFVRVRESKEFKRFF